MAKPKILFTLPTDASGLRVLGERVEVIVAADPKPETIKAMVGNADVLVVRTQLPADLLERPHHLLGIVRHGTGLDMIPVAAATAQNVPVANVPGVNAETVAEYVVGSFLTLARQLNLMDRDLRTAGWTESRRRAAEICHQAFRMRVHGHQRQLDALPGFVIGADVDTICRESDFIAVCCPLSPETLGLIDARRIALMKPGAFIANAARGPIIDEMALAAALTERRIGGAAIDVYAEQPLRRDHPFLGLDNILLTPACRRPHAGERAAHERGCRHAGVAVDRRRAARLSREPGDLGEAPRALAHNERSQAMGTDTKIRLVEAFPASFPVKEPVTQPRRQL